MNSSNGLVAMIASPNRMKCNSAGTGDNGSTPSKQSITDCNPRGHQESGSVLCRHLSNSDSAQSRCCRSMLTGDNSTRIFRWRKLTGSVSGRVDCSARSTAIPTRWAISCRSESPYLSRISASCCWYRSDDGD